MRVHIAVNHEYFVVKVFSDSLAYYLKTKHTKTYAHYYITFRYLFSANQIAIFVTTMI